MKKSEILDLRQAQEETARLFSERFLKIEDSVARQDSRNRNVIIAVLIAAVLIVAAAVIEVIISNRFEQSSYEGINDRIMNLNNKLNNLQNQNDLLRVRNPYLK